MKEDGGTLPPLLNEKMKLKKINDIDNLDILFELWNKEFGKIFPISKELFNRNIENIYHDASFVALEDNEIVGFILGKIWNNNYSIDSYKDCGWISLIYVEPKHRKKGIGSLLIEKAINVFKKLNKKTIYIGRDVHNFFPGLPIDMIKDLPFYLKNGFEYSYQTHDLISKNNSLIPLKNNQDLYTFRCATIDDKNNIINFINKNWPGRWTYEVIEYFEKGGNGNEYFICLDNNKNICAFAKVCYPTTNIDLISNSFTWYKRFLKPGGVGPLGVDPAYRGNHLGYDIVAGAVNELLKANATEIIIDWTGLLEFYRKLGFEVWKSYSYLTLKI